jgi:hypothetical protein
MSEQTYIQRQCHKPNMYKPVLISLHIIIYIYIYEKQLLKQYTLFVIQIFVLVYIIVFIMRNCSLF